MGPLFPHRTLIRFIFKKDLDICTVWNQRHIQEKYGEESLDLGLVFTDLWAYYQSCLDFYHRNGFIYGGLNPRKTPLYTSMYGALLQQGTLIPLCGIDSTHRTRMRPLFPYGTIWMFEWVCCCCWQGCTHLTNWFSQSSYTLAKAICHGIELTKLLFQVTALPLEPNVAPLQVFEFLPEAVVDSRQIAHLTSETCDICLHNLHQDHVQILLSSNRRRVLLNADLYLKQVLVPFQVSLLNQCLRPWGHRRQSRGLGVVTSKILRWGLWGIVGFHKILL